MPRNGSYWAMMHDAGFAVSVPRPLMPPIAALTADIGFGSEVPAVSKCSKLLHADQRLHRPQFVLTPADFSTRAHFSVSSTTNLPNTVGVIGMGSAPKSASRALMPASSKAALMLALSLSIGTAGVPRGAPRRHIEQAYLR